MSAAAAAVAAAAHAARMAAMDGSEPAVADGLVVLGVVLVLLAAWLGACVVGPFLDEGWA